MTRTELLPWPLDKVETRARQVGLGALVLLLIGLLFNPGHFFRSYFFAYLFVLGLPMGCLGMAMVHTLVGGGWGLIIRRFQAAAFSTLPYVAVLGLPLLLGLRFLYPWARSDQVAHEPALAYRAWCFNTPFFILRSGAYLAIWIVLALVFRRWSEQYDRTPDEPHRIRLQRLSAAGILIYILTMTLASLDWIMSREVQWYSTIFGFILVVGQTLAGFAFAVLVLTLLIRQRPFVNVVTPTHLNDLGTLVFMLVILFAYMAFAQYLIIWSGNIQEEITWYVARTAPGWKFLAGLLIVFHFFVPFFVLLSRNNKQAPRMLGIIAGLLLFMRLLDLLWMVAPSGGDPHTPPGFYWTDVVAPVALGGIWLKLCLWNLRSRPLLMRQQPGAEIAAYGEHASRGVD